MQHEDKIRDYEKKLENALDVLTEKVGMTRDEAVACIDQKT